MPNYQIIADRDPDRASAAIADAVRRDLSDQLPSKTCVAILIDKRTGSACICAGMPPRDLISVLEATVLAIRRANPLPERR